jgi:hypothetical protein
MATAFPAAPPASDPEALTPSARKAHVRSAALSAGRQAFAEAWAHMCGIEFEDLPPELRSELAPVLRAGVARGAAAAPSPSTVPASSTSGAAAGSALTSRGNGGGSDVDRAASAVRVALPKVVRTFLPGHCARDLLGAICADLRLPVPSGGSGQGGDRVITPWLLRPVAPSMTTGYKLKSVHGFALTPGARRREATLYSTKPLLGGSKGGQARAADAEQPADAHWSWPANAGAGAQCGLLGWCSGAPEEINMWYAALALKTREYRMFYDLPAYYDADVDRVAPVFFYGSAALAGAAPPAPHALLLPVPLKDASVPVILDAMRVARSLPPGTQLIMSFVNGKGKITTVFSGEHSLKKGKLFDGVNGLLSASPRYQRQLATALKGEGSNHIRVQIRDEEVSSVSSGPSGAAGAAAGAGGTDDPIEIDDGAAPESDVVCVHVGDDPTADTGSRYISLFHVEGNKQDDPASALCRRPGGVQGTAQLCTVGVPMLVRVDRGDTLRAVLLRARAQLLSGVQASTGGSPCPALIEAASAAWDAASPFLRVCDPPHGPPGLFGAQQCSIHDFALGALPPLPIPLPPPDSEHDVVVVQASQAPILLPQPPSVAPAGILSCVRDPSQEEDTDDDNAEHKSDIHGAVAPQRVPWPHTNYGFNGMYSNAGLATPDDMMGEAEFGGGDVRSGPSGPGIWSETTNPRRLASFGVGARGAGKGAGGDKLKNASAQIRDLDGLAWDYAQQLPTGQATISALNSSVLLLVHKEALPRCMTGGMHAPAAARRASDGYNYVSGASSKRKNNGAD